MGCLAGKHRPRNAGDHPQEPLGGHLRLLQRGAGQDPHADGEGLLPPLPEIRLVPGHVPAGGQPRLQQALAHLSPARRAGGRAGAARAGTRVPGAACPAFGRTAGILAGSPSAWSRTRHSSLSEWEPGASPCSSAEGTGFELRARGEEMGFPRAAAAEDSHRSLTRGIGRHRRLPLPLAGIKPRGAPAFSAGGILRLPLIPISSSCVLCMLCIETFHLLPVQ